MGEIVTHLRSRTRVAETAFRFFEAKSALKLLVVLDNLRQHPGACFAIHSSSTTANLSLGRGGLLLHWWSVQIPVRAVPLGLAAFRWVGSIAHPDDNSGFSKEAASTYLFSAAPVRPSGTPHR